MYGANVISFLEIFAQKKKKNLKTEAGSISPSRNTVTRRVEDKSNGINSQITETVLNTLHWHWTKRVVISTSLFKIKALLFKDL